MERLRTPDPRDGCKRCGGQVWHRTAFPDSGRASLTCVGCGHARNWSHGLTVVFIGTDPDEALAGTVTVT